MRIRRPTVSVVIPAKNEAGRLPDLLRDLANQSVRPIEVIVADSGSDDDTAEICRSVGAKVVCGGPPGLGRNAGASVAQGEWVLFLDADVRVMPDFVDVALRSVQELGIDVASFAFWTDGSRLLRGVHRIAKGYFRVMTRFGSPRGIGGAILVRRALHDARGGFDERVTVGEDLEYLGRLSRDSEYAFLPEPCVKLSIRRFRRRGVLQLLLQYIRMEGHRLLRGDIRDDRFRYFDESDESRHD